jgi:hypothetical protein
VAFTDGGGEFFAARKPVQGREKVMTFHRKTARFGAFRADVRTLNGAPVLLVDMPGAKPRIAERCAAWVELDAAGRIVELSWQLCPRKLQHLPWHELQRPGARLALGALRSALSTPPPASWALPAARRAGRAARRKLLALVDRS